MDSKRDCQVLVPGSWKHPERKVFEGKYCRLEPMELRHADQIYAIFNVPDAATRYGYLFGMPSSSRPEFDKWFAEKCVQQNPIPFVVVDKSTGKVEGKQDLMRIDSEHGSVEIGSILYGPNITRTRISTEAFYLMARYVLDELKYRRFEWKCDTNNKPSNRAAVRFGFHFEGIFRQHLIVHGRNRDTAWYSILDSEWPQLKASFDSWLDESNFDDQCQQKRSLQSMRSDAKGN